MPTQEESSEKRYTSPDHKSVSLKAIHDQAWKDFKALSAYKEMTMQECLEQLIKQEYERVFPNSNPRQY